MSDRRRHRDVLGTTTLPCPYCQGGPMMITRSERVRRLVDRANPRFDPDVVHHEVCAACNATFLVGEERIRDVLQPRNLRSLEAPAEERARVDVAAQPEPTADQPPAAPTRTTGPWGRADVTGPAPDPAPRHDDTSGSVLVGSPTRLGAGRRSGPVRRPPADRAS